MNREKQKEGDDRQRKKVREQVLKKKKKKGLHYTLNQIEFNLHVSLKMKSTRLLTGEILLIIASTLQLYVHIDIYYNS